MADQDSHPANTSIEPSPASSETGEGGEEPTSEVVRGDNRARLLQTRWAGPLPPPNLLEHYKDIQEDFPERLLQLTESEARHRREFNLKVLAAERQEVMIGQIFGLLVALAALVVTAYFVYLGHPGAAATFGSAVIIGLVTVFVKGRSSQSKSGEPEAHNPDDGPPTDSV